MQVIPKNTISFLKELKLNNNREWFSENKDKFKSILSTELASAGHFVVVERDPEALKELRAELSLFEGVENFKEIELVKPKYVFGFNSNVNPIFLLLIDLYINRFRFIDKLIYLILDFKVGTSKN